MLHIGPVLRGPSARLLGTSREIPSVPYQLSLKSSLEVDSVLHICYRQCGAIVCFQCPPKKLAGGVPTVRPFASAVGVVRHRVQVYAILGLGPIGFMLFFCFPALSANPRGRAEFGLGSVGLMQLAPRRCKTLASASNLMRAPPNRRCCPQ